MFKYFLKFLIIYFFLIVKSYSDISLVKDLSINGNKRISDNTVTVLAKIDLNKSYDDERLNKILVDLYETGFFSDVKIRIENQVLIINLKENPIIEDIEITGIKNKDFIKTLYEAMSLKNRMSFNEDLLKSDVLLILNILKRNGFYFSKVNPKFTKNELQNSIQLKINIDQGKKARIKKIDFIGNKEIKDKKLLEIIASEEHKFWKFISNKVYLNENTINLDKRLLENYYKNLGYKNVEIFETYAELTNQENFKLIYNINAGEKFYFNKFNLKLPSDYNQIDFQKVNKIFESLSGELFSLDNINKILKEVDNIASSRLYDFIDIRVEENIVDENKLDFIFDVINAEAFYIEKIDILGNFQTIEEVIRNRLIVDEGDPLNNLLLNKSLDNIKSLRIFKNVNGEIINGSNENLKKLIINVEEQPTGEISLAAGVGTSGSTIGGGVREKNFLGKGIDLTTNIEISEDSLKGQFIYSKPNFAYSENTLFTKFDATTKDFLTDFGYKVSNTSFSIGTEFEQFENLFFSPEIDLALEDLRTNSSASSQLKKQEGTYEDLYFNYGFDYDLRNAKFRPSSGNKTSFYQELPLISGNNEISNSFIFTQYKTLNNQSDMIGKASLYLKSVNSLDNSDVRISKRAQVPYNRLRGFEKGKVGPKDGSDYIGGNYVSSLNLSTNLPGILSTIENVDFSYFIDAANVWGVDYDSSIDESNFLRSSTGLGIDWLTPIGPLSFSFTQPLTKKSSDKTETFRFNLGTTF